MVRWLSITICLAIASLALSQQQVELLPTSDGHARLLYRYISRLPVQDQPYIRGATWIGTPWAVLTTRQRIDVFWKNSLTFEPDITLPREVPGSDGMLWAFDIRDFGWNHQAWHAVAQREPYCRQPWIGPDVANALRDIIHVEQDPKTLHVEAMVRADWLFRETAETDRSGAYYDLLFARQRFGDTQYWPAGKGYKAGWYYKGANQGGFVDANFPRDEKDWEKAFGADVILDLLRKQNLHVEHGAIVEEGVSIVARQNRLLWRTPIVTGAYWKTFDVLRTAGNKDYAETLIFDVKFDAGELIANLPNGSQAYLLIDGKGKRIETADGKAAIDSTDAHDRRVRTPGSCVVCHGQGINKPENLMEQFLKDGLDVRFRENRKAREVRAFFLGWDRKLKGDQDAYTDYVHKTAGAKGEANASAFKAWRSAYDAPVDLAQACAEWGYTEQQARVMALKSPHARLLMLIRGRTIPRAVFEADTFQEGMLLPLAVKGVDYVGH